MESIPNVDFDYYFSSFEYIGLDMPFLSVDIQSWPFNQGWLWDVRDLWLNQRVSEARMDAYLRPLAARR